MSPTYPDRVVARVLATLDRSGGPDACWPWTGYINPQGYGELGWGEAGRKTTSTVHSVVYRTQVGPVPDGLVIDHVCHNVDFSCAGGDTCIHRRCANPAHLEAVTSLVNIQRGRVRGSSSRPRPPRTHCLAGHELSEANTLVYVRPNGRVERTCRICNLGRARRWQDAHRLT